MDQRPIGIFDSGLGGLTALAALRKLLPDEKIIYFGDTARVPYGTKSASELRSMARQNLELLDACGVKAILAACGTVSSVAPDVLQAYPLPVFNVVDATVEEIARLGGDAPIGIIATHASIRSGVFEQKIAAVCPGREIVPVACQDFVRLIESGHLDKDDEEVRKSVRGYLEPMKQRGIGTLLLGCTHFGFLSDAIREFLGENVRLVSASDCAAASVRDHLVAHAMTGTEGGVRYLTSGSREQFVSLSTKLLGTDTAEFTEHTEPMEVKR